jgi:hypothetical protein
MAKFAVPLALSASAALPDEGPWQVHLGLELSYIPKVDDATATPTFCRRDKTGPENTDLLFALPRPRVRVTLPGRFALEGSWVPPITVSEARANLFGVAVSRTTGFGASRMRVTARAHATFGKVEGPITCDDAALQDSASPCYQGTRSRDAFHPNIVGVEGTLSWNLGGRVHPYLGAGWNHLAPRFQVNFTNQSGNVDRTRVVVDLDRAVLFGGATWSAHRLVLSGEFYSAPADGVTGRVMASIRLK